MNPEVPENEVRSVTHKVPAEALFAFLEAMNQEPNLARIEYVKIPGGCAVTVHYAVMDLISQLHATSARIERALKEASERPQTS